MQEKSLLKWVDAKHYYGSAAGKSHTSMDAVSNKSFNIPLQHNNKMMTLYCKDLLDPSIKHYLSEYQNPKGFPLFIDLDFKLKNGIQLDMAAEFRPMIKVIHCVVRDFYVYQVLLLLLLFLTFFLQAKPELFHFGVLTRQVKVTVDSQYGDTTSYGFHIHYYNLMVERETAIKIRSVRSLFFSFWIAKEMTGYIGTGKRFSNLETESIRSPDASGVNNISFSGASTTISGATFGSGSITETTTLTLAQSGGFFAIRNSGASYSITLPAILPGLSYHFFLDTTSPSANLDIKSGGSDTSGFDFWEQHHFYNECSAW